MIILNYPSSSHFDILWSLRFKTWRVTLDKAKIAPDKVKQAKKTVQDYCNRGERPELSWNSTFYNKREEDF